MVNFMNICPNDERMAAKIWKATGELCREAIEKSPGNVQGSDLERCKINEKGIDHRRKQLYWYKL